MNIREFFKSEDIEQVDLEELTIYYSNEPNFRTYAVVEDRDGRSVLVDVSGMDFDDFLTMMRRDFYGMLIPPLLGTAEVAKELGWSIQRVHNRVHRGTFLDPACYVSGRPAWTRQQIDQFKKEEK